MGFKKGTLFGKPKSEVVKHPGAFRRAAQTAGVSTSELAQRDKHKPGRIGKEARLDLTFAKMRGR